MGRSIQQTGPATARSREQLHREPTALKNKILLAIPESERKLIERDLEPFPLLPHTILHEHSRKLGFVYFPNRGVVSLLVTTEDGKAVEAGMVGSEGVLGAASAVGLSMSPLRQVVQISGDSLRMKVDVFQRHLKSAPELLMALSRYAVLQGMQMAQMAACNRLHDVSRRLARWLLMAEDRVDSKSLSVTHDFLAAILGTDRPSVSLAANALREKSIIQYRRGAIEILSRKKLESAACECYHVMQQFNGVLHLSSHSG